MKDRFVWPISGLVVAAATIACSWTTVAQSPSALSSLPERPAEGVVRFSSYRPGSLRCLVNWGSHGFYASAGSDGALCFWAPETLRLCPTTIPLLRTFDGGVELLSAASARFLAAADARGRVVVLRSEGEAKGDPAKRLRPFGEFRTANPVSALCVLPNGQVLVGDEEGGLSRWERRPKGFTLLQRLELGGLSVITALVPVSVDRVGVANEDGELFLVKRGTGSNPLSLLRSGATDDGARALHWCETSKRLICIGDFPGSYEWTLTGTKAHPTPGPIKAEHGPISSLAISKRGALLLARETGEILLQSAGAAPLPVMEAMTRIVQVGFRPLSASEDSFIALGRDRQLRTWRGQAFWLASSKGTTGAPASLNPFGPANYLRRRSPVLRGAWAPSGDELGLVTQSGKCQVWDTAKGTMRVEWSLPSPVAMTSIAACPDGKSWLTGDLSGRLARWVMGRPSVSWVFLHGSSINVVAADPAGEWIASGGWDGTVKVFSATHQFAKAMVLSGHTDAVKGMAFEPKGKQLASVADDGALIVWDVAMGKQRLRIDAHAAPVHDVTWSPDGQHLATGSLDGSLRVFDAQSGKRTQLIVGFKRGINTLQWLGNGKDIVASDSAGFLSWVSVARGEAMVDSTHHGLACTWAGVCDQGGGKKVASTSMTGDAVVSQRLSNSAVKPADARRMVLPRFGGLIQKLRRLDGDHWQVVGAWGRESNWKFSVRGEGTRVTAPKQLPPRSAAPEPDQISLFPIECTIPGSEFSVGCDAQGGVFWHRLEGHTMRAKIRTSYSLPRPAVRLLASESLTLIATDCGRLWLFENLSGNLLGVGGAHDDGRWWWHRAGGKLRRGRLK